MNRTLGIIMAVGLGAVAVTVGVMANEHAKLADSIETNLTYEYEASVPANAGFKLLKGETITVKIDGEAKFVSLLDANAKPDKQFIIRAADSEI